MDAPTQEGTAAQRGEIASPTRPTLGRIVLYRSRTGSYTVPAIITATVDSLNPAGVEAGHVPALTSENHVHLTVFTPGKPGMRGGAGNFQVASEHGISENVAGCYQEWDIPFGGTAPMPSLDEHDAATWRWPMDAPGARA